MQEIRLAKSLNCSQSLAPASPTHPHRKLFPRKKGCILKLARSPRFVEMSHSITATAARNRHYLLIFSTSRVLLSTASQSI
jgi:hypothetical protein